MSGMVQSTSGVQTAMGNIGQSAMSNLGQTQNTYGSFGQTNTNFNTSTNTNTPSLQDLGSSNYNINRTYGVIQ